MPGRSASPAARTVMSLNPHILEPLAELRGRVNFGLIGSGFRETSYPVCGTSAASAYSHCKNAEGTDDVSQRDTFHILGSPASGASALAGRGPGRPADAPPQAVGCSAGLDPDRGVAALLAGPGGAPACRTSGSGSRLLSPKRCSTSQPPAC